MHGILMGEGIPHGTLLSSSKTTSEKSANVSFRRYLLCFLDKMKKQINQSILFLYVNAAVQGVITQCFRGKKGSNSVKGFFSLFNWMIFL